MRTSIRRGVSAAAVLAASAVGLTACGLPETIGNVGSSGQSGGEDQQTEQVPEEIELSGTTTSGLQGAKNAGKGTKQTGYYKGLLVVGLTDDGTLVKFGTGSPGKVRKVGQVQGLSGDTSLIGIDYRVQDRKLYGVGNQGGIYTLNASNAQASKVSQLSVALDGTSFGVDFNPAANRLRVVSDTGQNLRHNIDDPNGAPAAGTTATDGSLTIPPATTPTTGITGAAYTNNDLDPNTATTLFDLDTALDQVEVQSPANAGSLAPTGKFGVDAQGNVGYDIYSQLGRDGRTSGNAGYATINTGNGAAFYQVGLLAGKANRIGSFPSNRQVVDIAIPLS
jgi:hypothetical protein